MRELHRWAAGSLLVLFVAVACGVPSPTPPPSTAVASVPASPTSLATVGSAVAPTSAAAISPSATADEAVAIAVETAERFQAARARGEFVTAWSLLSDEMQAVYGRVGTFVNDSIAYLASGAARFELMVIPADRREIEGLLREGDVPLPVIDLEHAVLVQVHHPDLPEGSAAERELFVVAPDGNGLWRLWRVG